MTMVRCLLVSTLVMLTTGCGGMDPDTTFIAEAGGHQLMVEEEAQMLAAVDEIRAPARAAIALANLWIDYVLLATAGAEDSTFAQLDLQPVVEQQVEEAVFAAVMDSVARAGATVPAGELSRRYDEEAEGSEMRVRQIMIALPAAAPAARHEAARETLVDLRRRIVEEGEDFEQLAQEYSQDPRTAGQGGDLGFVGPGDMLPQFEAAAKSLEPGEVSEVVQTAHGHHLIRLEERRTPTREQFAERLRRQRGREASAQYLSTLERQAAPRIHGDVTALIRQLALDPAADLPEGTSDTLMTYESGAVTVADARRFLRRQPSEVRQQIAGAGEPVIRQGVLQPLLRGRLVDAAARRQGLEASAEDVAAAVETLRGQVREAARQLGLLDVRPANPGEEVDLEPVIADLIAKTARDELPVVTLGPVSQVLRARYPSTLRDDRAVLVEQRLRELRGPTTEQTPAPATDSAGG